MDVQGSKLMHVLLASAVQLVPVVFYYLVGLTRKH